MNSYSDTNVMASGPSNGSSRGTQKQRPASMSSNHAYGNSSSMKSHTRGGIFASVARRLHLIKDKGHNEAHLPLVGLPSFEDFDVVKQVGTGTYGRVLLCKQKKTGRPCVIKCVNKEQSILKQQQAHLLGERDALVTLTESRCPFVVKVYSTFQNSTTLFFETEYVPGGELFHYIQRGVGMEERTVQFYTAQLVLALDVMHSECETVYRDIKPENLLLDSNGNLKIVDFGFAKKISQGAKTWTICGTPDYISPEAIKGRGYGRSSDIWAVGVLVYELLVGRPPFPSDQGMEKQFAKIVKADYTLPASLSAPARDFISKILQLDTALRLGCGSTGAKELLAHEFLAHIDKAALLAHTAPAPIIPRVGADPFNTSNYTAGAHSNPVAHPARTFMKVSKSKMHKCFRDFDSVVTHQA